MLWCLLRSPHKFFFGSSLPPIVCCLRIVVSNTYCVVLLFWLSSYCVLCTLCCYLLWIFHFLTCIHNLYQTIHTYPLIVRSWRPDCPVLTFFLYTLWFIRYWWIYSRSLIWIKYLPVDVKLHEGCHLWSRNCLPFWRTWFHLRSLVGFVQGFVDRCLSFRPFSLDHCIVCPSIYGSWLPLWYLQTLLKQQKSINQLIKCFDISLCLFIAGDCENNIH